MVSPVTCPTNPLTRDIDVYVSISRPQTELATDMTMAVFLTPGLEFRPDNDRVRYYSSMSALEEDVPWASEAWFAGNAFFSKQNRPTSFALGRVFEDPIEASLILGDYNLEALKFVTNGSFSIEIDGAAAVFDNMDFSNVVDIDDVIAVLQAAAPAGVTVGMLYDNNYAIYTDTTGEAATLSYAKTHTTGMNASALLGLTEGSGASLIQGYEPQGLLEEAKLVAAASFCNGRQIYGWTLDRQYRDTDDQKAFADWIESRVPAIFSACTNSVQAYNSADTTNIGYYAHANGYRRTCVIYHHNAQVYPDVSYLAEALSVNYSLSDSAITMKFKQLDGIDTSLLSETQVSVLESRNINSYVSVGNSSRTVRPGTQSADTWWTDSLVNLDNYKEELQVEVFNVFLRKKKIPYTTMGQTMLISAAEKINAKYTRNGVFAAREIEDSTTDLGYKIEPATNVVPTLIAFATTSERASRIAPPIAITAYEAGAMHKVNINVDVYN